MTHLNYHPFSLKRTCLQTPLLVGLIGLLGACGTTHPNNTTSGSAVIAPIAQPVLSQSPNAGLAGHVGVGYESKSSSDMRLGLSAAAPVAYLTTSMSSTMPHRSMPDTAKYDKITDNGIVQAAEQPVSTFSLDVDTGSYANTRRFLAENRLPPPDAVRVEELLNYFPSDSAHGKRLDNAPFAVDYELAQAPWAANKALLRVNVQAMDVNARRAPASHLTFLVDVSGSMNEDSKLPLVKRSLKLLVDQLRSQDTVSLVTYAGATRVVLQPTSGANKSTLLAAIDELNAGGSTAGASGLKLAYDMARKNFVKGDVNRVLLATDGDFNVGVTSTEELKSFIKRERDSGITLSTLGYGGNNFNDAMMEQIADVGNGNFSFIDNAREAEKVLKDEMGSTLLTVAKDVKAQIEFNPARVQEWRQIGYENRLLKREDFNNDTVDAGDIGAGKRVTVLYELLLQGGKSSIDPLRYQTNTGIPVPPVVDARMDELAFLKLRWKAPNADSSQLASVPVLAPAAIQPFTQASTDTRFMGAVAAFGQKLRNNAAVAQTPWEQIADWARTAKGEDANGYRAEFVQLVKDAKRLSLP